MTIDAPARDDLIVENQKLLTHIANKVAKRKRFNDLDELISAGQFGLIRAAERFDASKGFKFSTFAWPCIQNEMMQHINKQRHCVSLDAEVAEGDARTGYDLVADRKSQTPDAILMAKEDSSMRDVVKLAEARKLTPPPDQGIGAWADNLAMTALQNISADDVSEIIRLQVAKAKKGNRSAAQFVMNFVAGQASRLKQVKVIEVPAAPPNNQVQMRTESE